MPGNMFVSTRFAALGLVSDCRYTAVTEMANKAGYVT